MYVCLCNPFTEKDLETALEDDQVQNKASHLYKACTGGEKPCCGTCVCEIRDRIDAYNEKTLLLTEE